MEDEFAPMSTDHKDGEPVMYEGDYPEEDAKRGIFDKPEEDIIKETITEENPNSSRIAFNELLLEKIESTLKVIELDSLTSKVIMTNFKQPIEFLTQLINEEQEFTSEVIELCFSNFLLAYQLSSNLSDELSEEYEQTELLYGYFKNILEVLED